MDALLEPTVESICIRKGSQLGGSEAIYNILGYLIDQDPAPTLVVYPTVELARSVSSTRIQPMIDASPALKAKKPKDSDDFALQEMLFPNMPLFLSGANSPASLASRPCRFVLLDEIDKFPMFAGKEADPISLAEERQKTFWNRKRVKTSTPTIEDGPIMKEEARCDEVRDFNVACPHCGGMQVLKFPRVKWPDDLDRAAPDYPIRVRDSAWYECEHCRNRIEDQHRPALLSSGRWIARKPVKHPKAVGFVISSLYSPWLRWGDVAEAFVRAQGDPAKLMNFINSWLAEPWIQRVSEAKEADILAARCALPRLEIPAGAVALTCGIDMQKFGFWYRIRAHFRDGTSYGIDEGFLPDWPDLEHLLFESEFPSPDGPRRIWRALLDTGGGKDRESDVSRTEEAYQWLRANARGRGCQVFGCKGSSRPLPGKLQIGRPLDKTPSGKPLPGGLQLVLIDTEKAKDAFHWRLERARKQEVGAAYLHAETDERYARQILAEEKRRNKDGSEEWVRVSKENHLLDADCLSLAAADPELWGGVRVLRAPVAKQKDEEQDKPKPKPPEPNPFLGGLFGINSNPYTRR